MLKRRLKAPSPALVISLVALFVALGGTTYAATSLPKNSVGSEQLKKNAVTAAKIKNGAVTAKKINTKGLTVPDAAELGGVGPAGYQKVSTKTQYEVVPAIVLVPGDPGSLSTSYMADENGFGDQMQWCADDGGHFLYYAIHLPQGATIVSEDADYVDNGSTTGGNGDNFFTRNPLWNSGADPNDIIINPLDNTAAPGVTATATNAKPSSGTNVVDNTKYSYLIETEPIAGAYVCGIRIGYTLR